MTGPRQPARTRDRDAAGRPRNARPRDELGRPLSRDAAGESPLPDDLTLPPGAALDLAQELIDSGRAFRAHEVLEASWKAAPPAERDLWQGLAQVAVGLTHAQRGNARGAAALLRRGGRRVGRLRGLGAVRNRGGGRRPVRRGPGRAHRGRGPPRSDHPRAAAQAAVLARGDDPPEPPGVKCRSGLGAPSDPSRSRSRAIRSGRPPAGRRGWLCQSQPWVETLAVARAPRAASACTSAAVSAYPVCGTEIAAANTTP